MQIAADSALGNAPGSFTPAQLAFTGGGILKTTASFALDIKRGVQLGLGGGTFNTDPATTLAIQYDGSNAAIRVRGSSLKPAVGACLPVGNTYLGVTAINAGTLKIAADNSLGARPGNQLTFDGGVLQTTATLALASTRGLTINANGGTIDVDPGQTLTYNGIIAAGTGTGGLTKIDLGTLLLGGANTYTGVTTISGGMLGVSTLANGGVSSGIGQSSNAAANLILDGGTLQYTGAGTSSDRLFTLTSNGGGSTIDASGAGAFNLTNAGSVVLSGGGPQTLTLNGTNAGANTLAVAVPNGAGTTSLIKAGSGTWVLSGANTYTGTTSVIGGTLGLSGGSAIADTGAVVLANTAGVVLALQSSETIGSLAGGGATGGNVALNANTLTAGGNNATTTFAGVMSGAGALTKAGTGIFTLAGANTYTGTTTINAGTLEIGSGGTTGSIASANLVDNGTLSFNRSDAVSYNGVISSTGGVTVNGGGTLTLGSANTYSGATTVNGRAR